jgi:predicted DNA-binding protein (UPF0251 family)
MARPQCCRRVSGTPGCNVFRPEAGQRSAEAEMLRLTLDELEAMRLADLEGLYHEQAAERMNVSRQTFGRIIESARRKTAQALIEGMAIKIGGGNCEISGIRCFRCNDCHRRMEVPQGVSKPSVCPVCKGHHIHSENLKVEQDNVSERKD